MDWCDAVCAKVNSIEFLQFLMPAAHITPATPSLKPKKGVGVNWMGQRGGEDNLRRPHRKTRRIFFYPLQAVGSWQRACDLLGIDILMMCLGALTTPPPPLYPFSLPPRPLCRDRQRRLVLLPFARRSRSMRRRRMRTSPSSQGIPRHSTGHRHSR